MAGPAPTDDRRGLVELFARRPDVHPYGLGDLDEPYWSGSTWWRHGDAAAGLVHLPGSDIPVVYAVAAEDPDATLDLLGAIVPQLPDHLIINGVTGLLEPLRAQYDHDWVTPYWKMHLARPERLPDPDPRAEPIGRPHVDELLELFEVASSPEAFFTPELLDSGLYFGRRHDGQLVAVAGIHVWSRDHDVAALGNIATHPGHRRRGLATGLIGAVCAALRPDIGVVGLNVGQANTAALALYRAIGFDVVVDYEEAELRRR
jgi:ribosomal protein S18 acetylase RimI-like enzyme